LYGLRKAVLQCCATTAVVQLNIMLKECPLKATDTSTPRVANLHQIDGITRQDRSQVPRPPVASSGLSRGMDACCQLWRDLLLHIVPQHWEDLLDKGVQLLLEQQSWVLSLHLEHCFFVSDENTSTSPSPSVDFCCTIKPVFNLYTDYNSLPACSMLTTDNPTFVSESLIWLMKLKSVP